MTAIVDNIKNMKTETLSDANKLLLDVVSDALEHGNIEKLKDVMQRLDGIQGRVDQVNTTQTEAAQMQSADHALVTQLYKLCNQMIEVLNINSDTERRLISQLQDVHVNGQDLVDALELSAGTSVNRLVTKTAVKLVNDTFQQIDADKRKVEVASRAAITRINSFQRFLLIGFVSLGLVSLAPWLWVKLLLIVLGVVGGYLYDKSKN